MQVLPANPLASHLSGPNPVKGTVLPPNPLTASLAGTAAPVAPAPHPAPAPDPLTGYATKIATSTNLDPAFVQHLQALSKADPTFEAKLNAEINRVSTQIQAKRDSSTAGIIGQSVEGAVNPIEWAKTAITSAPDVVHGVGKIAHGDITGGAKQAGMGALGVAAVVPGLGRLGEGAKVALGLDKVGRTAEEAGAHTAQAVELAKSEGHGISKAQQAEQFLVKPGETTPQTAGEIGSQVRDALSGRSTALGHPHVAPYVTQGKEYVDGAIDRATVGSRGYVYHVTNVKNFDSITKNGLTPSQPAGDLKGVYFTHNALSSQRLAGASKAADSVIIRAQRDAVPDLALHPTKAYGEELTPHPVPASNLEYLGSDQQWHPLGGSVGQYEKVGARLDNPQLGQSAAQIRAAQEAGYSAERSSRAAEAAGAMQQHEGVAAYHAALSKLGGELPKIDFQGFKQFDQNALNAALDHVKNFEGLRTYEKVTAQRSLLNAVSGKVPTAGEQKLLERAFGKDVTQQIVNSTGFFGKAKSLGLEVLNVPRAIMASFDMSAPFRQGLVAGVTHPVIFGKNFVPMVKSFGSEKFFQGAMTDIEARPTFPLMQKAKLDLTSIGSDPHGAALQQREEQFMSNLAERIPGLGHGIRASDRAYVGFLNKTRADIFDHLVEQASKEGHDLTSQKTIGDIAKFVNSATGRGDLGALQKHAVTLNTLLFSPKLLASRINFLNPVYYIKLDPFARRQALLAARNLVGTMGMVMYLAKLGGAQVINDPRNADFGKIRIGSTRIDLAGGFTQPVRLLAQVFSGKVISSTTGNVLTLGPQGPGKLSRADIIQRFFESKLSPVPGQTWQALKGTQFGGQKLTTKAELESFLPLLLQDAMSLRSTPGGLPPGKGRYPAGGGLLGLDLFGMGIQSYANTPPKVTSSGGGGGYGDTGGGYGDNSGSYGDQSGGGYGG